MIEINLQKKLAGGDGLLELHFATQIQKGEMITLYGPTDAGKTSLLRMLAGLVKPDEGSIPVDGELWFDQVKKIDLKPQLRHVGMVFKGYSLFPNMSIRENLAHALTKGQDSGIVDHLLDIAGLLHLQHKKPLYLSGG